MPPQLNFKRYKIEDSYLEIYEADPAEPLGTSVFESEPYETLPLTSFSASYEVNSLPTARAVPAFGTRIGVGSRLSMDGELQAKLEGAPCELVVLLRFPGEEIGAPRRVTVIRGIVSTVSLQDSASGPSNRVSINLEIAHIASILGGAASSTYVYAGGGTDLDLNLQPAAKNPLRTQAITDSLLGVSEEVGEQSLQLGPSEALYPARVLKKAVQALHSEFDRGDGSAEADLIKTYDPTNLTSIPATELLATTIGREAVEAFLEQWRSSNCLDALKRVCAYFNIRILPYAQGLYIAAAYPLNKNVTTSLRPSEYVTVSRTKRADINQQVRGVRIVKENVIALVGAIRNTLFFPTTEDGKPLPNTYYFQKTYPRFLIPLRSLLNAPSDSTATLGEAAENAGAISTKVLRTAFGEEQVKNTAATVRVPFRVDIMPGSILEVKGLFDDGSPVSALGGVSYVGQVVRTIFTCDAGQGGQPFIHTDITLGGLRTKEDNDSDRFTSDGEPLYEASWVGMDLSGTLLSELPEHTQFNN